MSNTVHATRAGANVALLLDIEGKRWRVVLAPACAERLAAELAMAANIDLAEDLKRDEEGKYTDA